MPSARFIAVSLALLAAACSSTLFSSGSEVTGVRVLATRADEPFARPGESVTLEALAVDGRGGRGRPMGVYWIPTPCVNPMDDLYFACFSGLHVPTGVDLTPTLASGTSFTFVVPSDAISTHAPARSGPPFGFVVVFNVACPGHVEAVPSDPSHPQAPPLRCFDDSHNPLGPDEWVFGFSRVYVYDTLRNANPIINAVTANGAAVDSSAGVTLDHCGERPCPSIALDVDVPASSQEQEDPLVSGGTAAREQIWVDWFSNAGQLSDEARILYDPIGGRLTGTATTLLAPSAPGDATLWAVVHDDRGGVAWASIPLHFR